MEQITTKKVLNRIQKIACLIITGTMRTTVSQEALLGLPLLQVKINRSTTFPANISRATKNLDKRLKDLGEFKKK